MNDDVEMQGALDDLALHMVWPDPAFDVTERALAVLSAGPAPARNHQRRLVAAAALMLAAVALAVAAVPPARHAVADLLGIDGVRVTNQGGGPPDLDARLDLGRPVSLDEARQFGLAPLAVPAGIGGPDAAFAGHPPGGVSLVWAPTEGLPAVPSHEIGLLVTAFPGGLGRDVIEKQVFQDGSVERTTVDGQPAYWLAGAPHTIAYLDGRGRAQEDSVRLSGNALVWAEEDVVFRLESALGRDAAVDLAESIPR